MWHFWWCSCFSPWGWSDITKSGKEHWTWSQDKWLSPCLSEGGNSCPQLVPCSDQSVKLGTLMRGSKHKSINYSSILQGSGVPVKALWRPRELLNSNLNHKALSAKKVLVLRGILRKPPLTKLFMQMWFSNQRGGSKSILLVKKRMFLGGEPQWHVRGRSGLSVASRILRNGDSLALPGMAAGKGTCLGSGPSDPGTRRFADRQKGRIRRTVF